MTTAQSLLHRLRWTLLCCLAASWVSAAVATHLPPRCMPHIGLSDSVLHVAGFFVLAGLLWTTLRAYDFKRPRRLVLTLAVLAVYAAMDEKTQPMFGRDADVADWLCDMLGTVLAAGVCELLPCVLTRRNLGRR